jgi:hypothetical protein
VDRTLISLATRRRGGDEWLPDAGLLAMDMFMAREQANEAPPDDMLDAIFAAVRYPL